MARKRKDSHDIIVGLAAWSVRRYEDGFFEDWTFRKCEECGVFTVVSSRLLSAFRNSPVFCHSCAVKNRLGASGDVAVHEVTRQELEDLKIPQETIDKIVEAFTKAARVGLS